MSSHVCHTHIKPNIQGTFGKIPKICKFNFPRVPYHRRIYNNKMTNLKYWHENINMEFIGNIELYIDKDHSCLRIYDIHIRYFPQQEILVNSENTTLE